MCVSCNSHLKLVESFGQRKGLISSIDIVCSNSTCKRSVNVSDPFKDHSLNDASILGMRMAGCGLGALEELSACIGMLPPLSRPNWTRHNKNISANRYSVAKECCLEGKELGMKCLFNGLGMEFTQQANEFYKSLDRKRLYKSEKRSLEVEKKKRKWKTKDKQLLRRMLYRRKGLHMVLVNFRNVAQYYFPIYGSSTLTSLFRL